MRQRPAFLVLLVLSLGLLATSTVTAQQSRGDEIRVRYRSADTVYLDAGRLAGLSVGDQLELRREGRTVARIEVVFVADHSASARPLEETAEILEGDLARPLGALRPPPTRENAPSAPSATEPRDPPRTLGSRASRTARRSTRFSGVVSLDHERFSDGDDDGRDLDETTARLSLRGRDLAGLPLDLRVRLRSRTVDRARALSGGIDASEDRDRLYELSLRWRPESDRFEVAVGRLGAGPFSGIGYLDGISGRFSIVPSWQVGAFYGQRPEIADLGFDSAGTKYGLFSRWSPRATTEVFVAAVEEENEAGLSRRLAVLETRLGPTGGRWSFLQRAEIDFGGSGDVGAGAGEDENQLTQLALALSARLGETGRLVLSYDRYDPLLLFEDAPETPAESFRDLLRQGLRASLYFGREAGVTVSLSGGLRRGEGSFEIGQDADEESTYSLGLGVRRSRARGHSWSADLLGFSNPFTEGALLTVRSRWGFVHGHALGVVLGATGYEDTLGEQRVSGWARLETWVELPASLFARGDFEVLLGDDTEGQRLRLGLGYRF